MRDIRDLVERLRKNDAKAAVSTSQEPPFSIQGEAADEIERLRKLCSEAPREGWIPVSERLPEIDMSKATYERGTKVLMAWGPSQQNVGEGHYTANWYSKQAKALAPKFYWQGRIAPWKITHWMHFPAGPGRSEGKT
jgi:hypothetical protein